MRRVETHGQDARATTLRESFAPENIIFTNSSTGCLAETLEFQRRRRGIFVARSSQIRKLRQERHIPMSLLRSWENESGLFYKDSAPNGANFPGHLPPGRDVAELNVAFAVPI